jgi:protein involved in polysaccharide export with SLBB domain
MDVVLAARPQRAGVARIAHCAAAVAVVLGLAGCSSSGGTSVLFPNDHKLLRSARYIASTTRPGPVPRELAKQPLEAFYVQPGDVLLLEVTDLESDIRLPADQTVMPDGTIDLGEYGRLVVAGMTVEQIEAVVLSAVQAVAKDQTVKPINVRLNVVESAVFYVLGEVNSPGAYPLLGRETVLDALMVAGGLSDRASECSIILARPTPPPSCRIVLPVCYDRIVQLGDTTTNYQIRPGDRIFVGTRTCCEQLAFWRSGCPNCPDWCDQGCRTGLAPAEPPFVVPYADEVEAEPVSPLPDAGEADALPLPLETSAPPSTSSPVKTAAASEPGGATWAR